MGEGGRAEVDEVVWGCLGVGLRSTQIRGTFFLVLFCLVVCSFVCICSCAGWIVLFSLLLLLLGEQIAA